VDLDHHTRDQKIRRAVRRERDFANAGLVGSGAVGVGLLLDPAALPRTNYWVLVLLDGLLLAAAAWSSVEALRLAGASKTTVLSAINRLLAALSLAEIGGLSVLASSHERAIQPHSSSWWELVIGAFAVGFGFWFHRNRVEEVLDRMAETPQAHT
jgi:hypothetical protein